MQCMLNFSKEEKQKVLLSLKNFPEKETKTKFEEFRCAIGESTVTLYSTGKLLIQGDDCKTVKEKVLENIGLEGEQVLGIDETGRGEDFGPFVIAAVLADSSKLRELRDSKKVKNIEEKRKIVEENSDAIAVVSISAEHLDSLRKNGVNLNRIEASAINAMVSLFNVVSGKPRVVVDGKPLKGCLPGIEFVVKADDLNPVVGAASIIAKSERTKGDKTKRKFWGNKK